MKAETLEQPEMTIASSTASLASPEMAGQSPAITHLKNILVPLDFSEMSLKSLQYAIPFASQFGATLTLLHVVQAPVYTVDFSCYPPLRAEQLAGIRQQLEEIRRVNIPAELSVNIVLRESLVFDGIVEEAREIPADLIIATTHGRTGLQHLIMGSTAEYVVRRAPCPVLVVREIEHDFV